jgi:hypothetical protein
MAAFPGEAEPSVEAIRYSLLDYIAPATRARSSNDPNTDNGANLLVRSTGWPSRVNG